MRQIMCSCAELGGNWWIDTHHRHPKLMCLKCGLPLCTGDEGGHPPPQDGLLVTIEGYDGRPMLGNFVLMPLMMAYQEVVGGGDESLEVLYDSCIVLHKSEISLS